MTPTKPLIATVALLCAIVVGGFTYALFGSTGGSSATCYTFTRSYPQGLMDSFQGKVCTTSPSVQRIASQYNQCVKQTGQAPQCGYALLSYLAAGGAYPEDAAKAELLVLTAASGG